MHKSSVLKWVVLAGVLLAMASPAMAGGKKNYVQVYNQWKVKMWVTFKCYTNTSWEQNTCRYENTYVTIDPGHSHKWDYNFHQGMGCQKIYVRYGRYDRSCDGCTKILDEAFAENEAKRFKIVEQGSGDLGFIMQPIHGTYID